MSDEIIKLLDDLGQRFGIAIDWSSENMMPYIPIFVRYRQNKTLRRCYVKRSPFGGLLFV